MLVFLSCNASQRGLATIVRSTSACVARHKSVSDSSAAMSERLSFEPCRESFDPASDVNREADLITWFERKRAKTDLELT